MVEHVAGLVDHGVLATIVIDLLNASFIDATGVGALVKAKNKAQAAGLALDVVGVHGQIAQVFALVGFRDHLAGRVDLKCDGGAAAMAI
jgi:anti-anti-sigma factor